MNLEETIELNTNKQINFNINDPRNYYCLGVFDEANQIWRCVSRKIESINGNSIKFKLPFPGIYAVIFNPIRV